MTSPGIRVCLGLTSLFKALVPPAVQCALQVVVGYETSVVDNIPLDWLTVVPEVVMTISVTEGRPVGKLVDTATPVFGSSASQFVPVRPGGHVHT